jgi:hypothetical protein
MNQWASPLKPGVLLYITLLGEPVQNQMIKVCTKVIFQSSDLWPFGSEECSILTPHNGGTKDGSQGC